jgi:hypothetical protein
LPEQKKQQALSLLEEVLLNTERITPVEYRILTEVEAANLLWQLDKERSVSILKNVIKDVAKLLEEERRSKESTVAEKNLRRGSFLALRKIAALEPGLLKSLSIDRLSDDGPEAIPEEWTDGTRAILSVAEDVVEKDPNLAAHLFEQSLSLGS